LFLFYLVLIWEHKNWVFILVDEIRYGY
jgi:hypothetical protein